ncbi:hypothetical protein Q5H92_17610 [Hymenobacter sp. M29]|uniref:Uncharacterized protein n=1 Tax=Hymenobacter mellowenesis TaxID=3063995 RepID=A0ABT9AEC5_9BACT|nr:hypothetical protein [Hymenobacter sp. M29]MDO7848188.1 hypothetical protein [Hymenobacter sp. M29]
MKKLLFLVLSIVLFTQEVDAQIRVEGVVWPPPSTQAQIEAAIEDGFHSGRIENGGAAWSNLMKQILVNDHRPIAPSVSVDLSSLSERGYYLDRTGTKNYCISQPESGLLFLVRVVSCDDLFHYGGCALGIISICRSDDVGPYQKLSKAQKRAYKNQLKQYLLSPGRLALKY